jgi:hypothetical protein
VASKKELPDFQEKRRILFGPKTTPAALRETGRLFMHAERYDDALEFFSRTDAADEVRKIAQIALTRGDTSLFLRAKRVLKEKATEEELSAVARNALAAGRKPMAYVALLKAGHAEEAEKLRAELFGSETRPGGSQEPAPAGPASAAPQQEKEAAPQKK